jgi:biotin carboxylase
MKTPEKNIIAYVMKLPSMVPDSLKAYQKMTGKKFKIMLIREEGFEETATAPKYDILVTCDFSKPGSIATALLPYQGKILAITCRGDNDIARFAKVIPHVPYLRTPQSESLAWAVDKYEMRKRFKLFNPAVTPKFTRIKDNTKAERKRAITKIGFPMIVKPTNLAASLFVTICYHEEELEKALKTAFRKINKAYEHDKRMEEPKLIAEEYMEGDMYSIDSYVNSRGKVYHCPLVRVKTGKDIGHDDFFNYLQMTPTGLKAPSVEKARIAAETAIHALGLRNTTTHTELMKIDDVWKIIEIGPRMGGFRHELHQLSCDIDHSLNDILIRIPKKPIIPKKCKGFAAAMKWFVSKEGKITEMKGIKKIEQLESFHKIVINKKVGDRAVFARNGGRSIFNVFLYNADRSKLLADIRRLEKLVRIKVS